MDSPDTRFSYSIPSPVMHQIRAHSWKEKFTHFGYFFAALLLHLILFIMVATIVIFHASAPPTEPVFRQIHIAVPPPPPAPPPPAGSTAATPTEPQTEFVPPTAPRNVISNAQSTSFQVDTSKVMAHALTQLNLPAPQSTGLSQGGGDLNHASGSSATIDFFGVHTGGKRIAFLLDYSGSMEGTFRTTMEKQLEKTLDSLPDGTQVILICWAGPAWLYNQTAPQIAGKWKKIGGYDDFTTVPDVTLDPPQWIQTSPTSVAEIMKGIKAQVSDPGGTDWRQPFRYAMRADPPPDVIFFLTDGQIPPGNTGRALDAISVAMNKADTPPQINCLWIENKSEKSTTMEILAQKYNGEFRKVSAKDGGP